MIASRYTLVREIGRGGMGGVWLATDEILGRQVAMKRVGMFPGGSSPDTDRAEREAKLAARLNHPHVVAVFDYVTEGDVQWLVMEYVEGRTLAELARGRGGLPAGEAAPILRQVAEALAAAHEAGIVHRDVKPSNILVTEDGVAKLADFGIARAQADATLTQTGLVTGSPAYLAPEVVSGRTATEASDVWSLGATTYQALSGHPPYEVGENVVAALYRIVHEPPPRLASAGWLGPLLDNTMALDPAHRWSMAQARDFLDGIPVAPVAPLDAGPDTSAGTAAPAIAPNPMVVAPSRGRRGRVAGAVIGSVLAVGLVAMGVWLLTRDGTDPPVANPSGGRDGTASATGSVTPRSPGPSETPATAESMAAFVRDYLDTVVREPRAAWDRLTPQFQNRSGGLAAYLDFWEPVANAKVTNLSADPANLTVSYDVRYAGRGVRTRGGHVELRLVRNGDSYLIAAEPTG